ncbi:MAG: hypothetical protein H9993_00405, partial [Candidatus Desulfovibrio faecigallinarum]|nr:hypothetical protein [Candidatus Desulfovibrio faecigallinarum]
MKIFDRQLANFDLDRQEYAQIKRQISNESALWHQDRGCHRATGSYSALDSAEAGITFFSACLQWRLYGPYYRR